MTVLTPYDPSRRQSVIAMVAAFFADHFAVSENEPTEITPERLAAAEEDLDDWFQKDDATLFIIEEDGAEAGVLLLATHGGSVVWIENLYVKRELRRRGIASRAIALAEEYAVNVMNAPAISMDVIPQNRNAMRLYHSLGYTTLQMITMRKPLNGDKRENTINLFELEFKI